jgi:hypothetical protein
MTAVRMADWMAGDKKKRKILLSAARTYKKKKSNLVIESLEFELFPASFFRSLPSVNAPLWEQII